MQARLPTHQLGLNLPGFDAIRMPGEQRRQRRAERARDGVPMPAELIAQLDKLAGELGVKRLSER